MKRISMVFAAGLFAAVFCAAQNSPAADLSNFRQEGIASWYGTEFDGRPTASGEIFNSSLYTAAHPSLPFGTHLTVTNLNNGRKVNVRVNDRGPFVSSRIIDLSQAAARMLDMVSAGTAPVLVEIMKNDLAYGNPVYNQGNSGTYQAETDARAVSEGGYSNAVSQIVAPAYPVYQNPPPPSADPVVIQVQPPQQQITQYFQQPAQPQPQVPPRQAPVQQIQPVQQVLPVQQVQPLIQPVQPVVQPVIVPQPVQPAPAAQAGPGTQPQQAAQPAPGAPAQQIQPVQIQIPIEVKPFVSSPEPPTAPPPSPAEPAPHTSPAPAAAIPAPASMATIKPNKVYRVQIGSYKEARNALAVFERLKGAGLNPVYERNGEYFRVVLSGIPSEAIGETLQKLTASGFSDPLLREER